MSKKVIIGSRESRLAVIQSEMVRDYILSYNKDCEVELLTMKTTGDKILDCTLDKVGGKGLFVKELDKALLEKKSQLSVHSLKDMPMEVPEELPLLAFSKREDPRDVLVLPEGIKELDESKPIGCSSLRRTLQLKELYPNMEFKSVRGNVQTRLKKLDEGQYSALVLAAAGLKRLKLENRISRYFEPEEVLPAAGQGILAIQGRKDEDYSYLDGYNDEDSECAALAERAFVRYLDGGCSSPVAAHAKVEKDKIILTGLYYEEESGAWRKASLRGKREEAEELGIRLAKQLKYPGKVWLVGAGPGDIGLFTLKGMEVLKNEEEYVLVNFYFDFDKDLQDAAKAYANSESNEEEFSNAWYNEYYFPYLYDFANDEVLEVIEQVIETLDVEGEMMAFQMTEKTSDYVQVMALFTEEDSNVVIEDVVREYIAK